jgi:hypothetical protein
MHGNAERTVSPPLADEIVRRLVDALHREPIIL